MRVLLIDQVENYIGGAETYIQRYLNLLKQGNINAQLYTFRSVDDENFEKLVRKIRVFAPSILHFNKFICLNKKQANLIRQFCIPVILTVHDLCRVPFKVNLKNRLKNLMHGKIWYFDHFIIPSKVIFKELKNKGVENLYFMPQFIDVTNWQLESEDRKKNNLLYVGRLEANKGIFLLVKTFRELKKCYKNLCLTIIGEGSEYGNLLAFVESLDLAKDVHVLGYKPQSEIVKYYRSSSILIFPTIAGELFGLVGLEAQACKIPVIASNLEVVSEWCEDGSTGITFKVEDQSDLQNKISSLLADSRKYKQLQENGYAFVKQHFTVSNAREIAMNIYRDILG